MNKITCANCGYNFLDNIFTSTHKCRISRRILYQFVNAKFSILDILICATFPLFHDKFLFFTFLMLYWATKSHIKWLIFKRDLK